MATRITDLRTQGDYQSLDDRLLVLDFQAGQPEAFVEVHRRYGALARHVCARFLPNRQDADEAFQETMIRVFQGLHRFNGRYALQPWVARIATNVSLDQIRTRTRRPLVEDGLFEDTERRDPADGPEEAIERLIERDLVISVLSGLPDSHRTALVLRELEGRSHREIAEKLDITPAQAKALIHRAKGSFRRNWLIAITEKGGLTGIALLPVLWLAKAADGARRVVERLGGHAGQVAQAATPEIVTSASAVSSPAVAAAATTVTERFVAAGMTLLLAGGVTVGAATVVKERNDRRPAERVVAVAPPAVVEEREPKAPAEAGVPVVEEPEAQEQPSETVPEEVVEVPAGVIEPTVAPTVDPTVAPTVEPTVAPTVEPTVEPTVDPTVDPTVPPPVPAPEWAGSVTVDWSTSDECGCEGLELTTSHTTGNVLTPEAVLEITQKFQGAALDAEGDAAWFVDLQLWADLEAARGSGTVTFTLGRGDEVATFLGTMDAVAIVRSPESGDLTYTLVGEFSALPSEDSPIAIDGIFQVDLLVWSDGATVIETDVQLFPGVDPASDAIARLP